MDTPRKNAEKSVPKPSENAISGRRPSDDAVKALYHAHAVYQAAQPWEVLPDDQPLVIHNTLRQQTGYLATHRDGTSYYHGRSGLIDYQRAELMLPNLRECLTVFYRRPELMNSSEILQVNLLGIRPAADGTIPVFRSIHPYHMQWPPNAPQTQLLAYAMRQTAAVATHLRQNPSDQRPKATDPPLAPIWTTAYQTSATLEWMALPDAEQLAPKHPVYEPEMLREAQALPKTDETWNLRQAMLPNPLYEQAYQDARPQYPVATMVTTNNDPPQHLTMLDLERHEADRHQSVFLQCMIQLGRTPRKVNVFHPLIIDGLAPLAEPLELEINHVADLHFEYENLFPIMEQMEQFGIDDGLTHEEPATATAKPETLKLPESKGTAQQRRHRAAALLEGMYYHPKREVTTPENLATPEYLDADMTPAAALHTIAIINGGHVNLEMAARIMAAAGIRKSQKFSSLVEELQQAVEQNLGWIIDEAGVAHHDKAAQEEMPKRIDAPRRNATAPAPALSGTATTTEVVPGLFKEMTITAALETIADHYGPDIAIREATRQIIEAGVSRSQNVRNVSANLREIIKKSPRWTMTTRGRARRQTAHS